MVVYNSSLDVPDSSQRQMFTLVDDIAEDYYLYNDEDSGANGRTLELTERIGVEYKFVSGTDGKTLPEEVTGLLPEDNNVYEYEDAVTAVSPSQTRVTASGGIWRFTGYDKADETVISRANTADGKLTFTGTWEFIENASIITPEDQTIYTGGADGSVSNAEFPHPIYLVTDSEGNETELGDDVSFYVDGVLWEDEESEYPFTVEYYDAEGNEITDDEHYGDFTAKIVPAEGVDADKITIGNAPGSPVFFEDGTLRIRYVSSYTDASANSLTTEAQTYTAETEETVKQQAEETAVSSGGAVAVLKDGTQILLNGNENYAYPEDAPSKIALLFDELLPSSDGGDNSSYIDLLSSHAEESGYTMEGWNSIYRYLDLVDMNDSNAWVASTEGCDVFWPYPEGADQDSEIRLLHFKGLHREYSMAGEDSLAEQVGQSEIETVEVTKTENGVWFHIPESGFSPFALTWQNYYTPEYEFVSGTDGEELPEEVKAFLPEDEDTYLEGTDITAIQPDETTVKTEDGIWTFQGWDAEKKTSAENVKFTGTWTYALNASVINRIPEISASDKTLTVGDEFSDEIALDGVTATDEEDGDLTEAVKVKESDVDTSKAGEYTVTYEVTDSEGATAYKTIVVTVKEKEADPEPEEPGTDTPDVDEPGTDEPAEEEPGSEAPETETPDDTESVKEPADTDNSDKTDNAQKNSVTKDTEETSESVQTGVAEHLFKWMGMAVASFTVILGCIWIVIRRRNKRS